MFDLRPVLYILGLLLLVLAAAMVLTGAVERLSGGPDWTVFLQSAGVTLFCGLLLVLGARPRGALRLGVRQAFLMALSCWLGIAVFAALPFALSSLALAPADAVFEAVSGITTTGATVLLSVQDAPSGILFWRALLQWLGGIGVIFMGVAILPALKIGGMEFFHMESTERSEKIVPRITDLAMSIGAIYFVMTVVCVLFLILAGLSPFDAVTHAMATVSTGGFSTHDASVGHFANPLAEWVISLFMVLGGLTFVLYITIGQGRLRAVLEDGQVRWYGAVLVFFSVLMALWLWLSGLMPGEESLRRAVFNTVSIITTTGFHSDDFSAWGPFATTVFFMLLFVGGCTGSTAGGLKIFRYQILFGMAKCHIRRLLHPHGMFVITYNRRLVPEGIVRAVVGYAVLYAFATGVFALGLSMSGLDLLSSLSGAAAALSNVGPGLGPVIGPSGSYALLDDGAKWLVSLAMIMGRLELLAVIVVFTAAFWRE